MIIGIRFNTETHSICTPEQHFCSRMSVDGIVSDMMLELCVEICVLDFLNESLRSGCRVRGAQDGTAHYDIVGAGRDRVGDSHRSSLVVGWTRGAPYPRGNNDEIRP